MLLRRLAERIRVLREKSLASNRAENTTEVIGNSREAPAACYDHRPGDDRYVGSINDRV